MPSLLFPDAGSRFCQDARTGRPARGKTARLFLDSALTTAATIYTDANGAPGAAIPGAQVVTDQFGYLPLFWGPTDGRDTLWISVNGGPAWAVKADTDARLDLLAARVDDVEAGGGSGSGSDLVHRSGSETITGAKTFTTSPVVPEPSDQTHAVRRAYVDNAVTAEAGTRAAADAALDGRVSDLESLPAAASYSYVDSGDAAVTQAAADALATHVVDSTNVHGITNTALLETQAGAQAKADAAQAAAIAAIPAFGTTAGTAAEGDHTHAGGGGSGVSQEDLDDAIVAHNADTTSVHGIADTAALETTSGAQAKADAAQAAAVGSSAQRASNLSDLASASTARTNLGLGTAATTNTGTGASNTILGNDSRLTDARTPTAHASSHASAGSDPITVAQSQVTGLTTDLAAKAPLASPALTGTPTAPTASAATNNTQLATTAYVTSAVSTLSGTTTTALGTKLDKTVQFVNVKDHGALGDNTADDTTAIQAAITAAGAGGVVFFPVGNYKFSTINLDNGQTLRGVGWRVARDGMTTFGNSGYTNTSLLTGSVLRSTATSGNAILHMNTGTHVGGRIEDLAIIGPGSGTSVGVYMGRDDPTPANIRAVIKPQYRNVFLANFATGLVGYHVNEASFYDLCVRGCTKAISAAGDFNNVAWIGLDIQRCDQGWVCEVQANNDYRIIGNTFVSPIIQNVTGEGFVIRGEANTIITPYFENAGTSATFLRTIGAYWCSVINPTVHGSGTRNIDVDSTSFYNEFTGLELHSATCTMTNDGYGTVISGQLTDAGGSGLTDTGDHTHRVDLNGATYQIPRVITGTTSGSNPALQTTGLILARYGTSGPIDRWGTGSPEGSVTAPVGSVYRRTDGGSATTFWVKETGTGNTGWVAVGAGGGGAGDASTNTASSVDSEVALFSGTGGKTLKRATGSGVAVLTSGVLSTTTQPAGSLVGTTATQTLTNKTLTAPAISSPTGLVKADVGLGNVDNVADLSKPISTATQTALDLKAPLASPTFTGTPAAPTATAGTNTTQLATTAFVTGAISTSAATKENTITAGTTSQYWRGDKSWQTLDKSAVGLGNVDNTSDATKNAATATLTNKRITPRVTSTASSATPTPSYDTDDQYVLTALAANAAFAAPTGTPTDGQSLIIRIKDNGSARTLSWNATYRAVGVTLPTTTVAGKVMYIGCRYNAAETVLDVLAVSIQA